MPFGDFLDTLPVAMFMVIHAVLLIIGLWAYKKTSMSKLKYAQAFLLYSLVHVNFLAALAGFYTLKMGIVIEQVLILAMVLWIVMSSK